MSTELLLLSVGVALCLAIAPTESKLAEKVVKQPTVAELRFHCPKDRRYCAPQAARGRCVGPLGTAAYFRKRKCRCTCKNYIYMRQQKCCGALFPEKMHHCLPMCRYNITKEEVGLRRVYYCANVDVMHPRYSADWCQKRHLLLHASNVRTLPLGHRQRRQRSCTALFGRPVFKQSQLRIAY